MYSFNKNTKFLVTGGAGFIGSHLIKKILELGYKVVCLDNLSTGKIDNIIKFLDNENFTFINGDIRNLETCILATRGVNYVLHQAAWGSVPKSIEMPLIYEEINIKGTLNMMEASRINCVKKFVYASSSSVYGDSVLLPKVEGQEGIPISPYALTKRVNEDYAKLYKKIYNLDTYGLRYFNVFGPNQNPEGPYAAVIPKFIIALFKNETPIINGDGSQSRDFTFVNNVVDANLKACLAGSHFAGETYNIGTGSNISINEIHREISFILNKNNTPSYGPIRFGDIEHSIANIQKAKNKLKYNPEWDFKTGLKETIEWYKNNYLSTDNSHK